MRKAIPLLLCTFFCSCSYLVPRAVYLPGTEYVTASWYGQEFHGRPTSSGEIFDMNELTCAHRELPFGTRLEVTNPENHRSVIVTVNDRGPFIPGRDLDLSYAAAREIGFAEKGVGRVKVRHLGRDVRYARDAGSLPAGGSRGPFTVQVGSFIEESNASHLREGLRIRYKDVFITTVFLDGQKYYRVRIGTFGDMDSAYSLSKTLAGEGYSTVIVRQD